MSICECGKGSGIRQPKAVQITNKSPREGDRSTEIVRRLWITRYGTVNERVETVIDPKMSYFDMSIHDPSNAYNVSQSVFPSGLDIRVSKQEEDNSSNERTAGAEVGIGGFPVNASVGGNFKRDTRDHSQSLFEARTNMTTVVVKIEGGSNGAKCTGCGKTELKIYLLTKPSTSSLEPQQTPQAPHSARNEPLEEPSQIPVATVPRSAASLGATPPKRKASPPAELAVRKGPEEGVDPKTSAAKPPFRV